MHVTGWGRSAWVLTDSPPRRLSRRARWLLAALGLLVLAVESSTAWAWLFEGVDLETTARQDLTVSVLSGLALILGLTGPTALCVAYVVVAALAAAGGFYAMPVLTLPLALAFGAVYLRGRMLRAFVAVLALVLAASLLLHPERGDVVPYLLTPALVGLAGGLAVRRESNQLTTARLRGQQLAEDRDRAVAEVRRGLARDLHDVVAQQLAIIAMQTQAMKVAPDAATQRAMADTVAEVAREAHADLRGLLGVLYTATDAPPREDGGLASTLVAPASEAVEAAARRLREDGFQVAVEAEDSAVAGVPRHVDATVHRIVQEACANVLRHAPAGSRCELRLSVSGGAARVHVVNEMRPAHEAERFDRPAAGDDSRRSFGIVNIVERAELLGGHAEVGPRDGRWHVEVALPFTPVR